MTPWATFANSGKSQMGFVQIRCIPTLHLASPAIPKSLPMNIHPAPAPKRTRSASPPSTPRPIDLGIHNAFENYFHPMRLYLQLFDRIPHKVSAHPVDCRKANDWFLKAHEDSIRDLHYSMQWDTRSDGPFRELVYLLEDDLMLHFDILSHEVTALFRHTDPERVQQLLGGIARFKPRMGKVPKLFLIGQSPRGLEVKPMMIDRQKLSIADHYNDDFQAVHQTIINRLRKKKDKGLVLLHGEPGTGKTSYIRYLIAQLRKPVIFMPPNMAGHVASPDLLDLLIEHPDSVLVIEDAEQIVTSREIDGNSPVSGLLNLCDGLLSDCLRIQVICSFNTGLSRIDPALLRRGRLIARYEFGKLNVGKAEALARKLGNTEPVTEAMTLASIYHSEEPGGQLGLRPAPRIGFRKVELPF